MIFITISEELNYQLIFLSLSPSHFSNFLYMHYTYTYRTSCFDLIVGSSNVKSKEFYCEKFYLNQDP